MTQIVQWLAMGKYAIYVWPAYATVGTIFIANLIALKKYRKRVTQRIRKQYRGQV